MVNHESDSDYSPSEAESSDEGASKVVTSTPGPNAKSKMKPPSLDDDDEDTYDEDDVEEEDEDDDSSDDDRFPGPAMLVINVEHQGKQHNVSPDNKITYLYKKTDGSLSPLSLDDDEIISIQHEDKVMQLKKSVVDEYRKKTKYWGPLKASVERCTVKRNGVEKEVLRTKLNQIKFTAKDKAGNWLTGEGLRNAMAKTPGVIPPCDPLSESQKDTETLAITLEKGVKIEVRKKAVEEFKKLAGVEGPLKTQVKRVLQKKNGNEVAVTKLFLSSVMKPQPKKAKPMPKPIDNKRKVYNTMGKMVTPEAKKPRLAKPFTPIEPPRGQTQNRNYASLMDRTKGIYAQPAPQPPKVLLGAKFLQDVCGKTYEVESPLGAFGCYKGRTTKNTPEDQDNTNNFIPNDQDLDVVFVESTPENMRAILPAEQLWIYLTDCAQVDSYLLDFAYAIDQDRWLEVKRSSEMFQINGEVWPDLTLKVVLRDNSVTYFLRVLGRVVKTGSLSNGLDVKNLLRCMASNRRVCVGLSMDPYLEVMDKNEQLRTCLKDSTQITMLPYMSVRSRHCQGIVRAPNETPNGTFTRAGVSIIGSEVVCQVCIGLGRKLNIMAQELDEPHTKISNSSQQDGYMVRSALPIRKPAFIPVQKILKNSKLKDIFTETLDDVLGIGPKKLNHLGQPKATCKRKFNEEDDNRPSIVASESDFLKMMVLQSTVQNNQRKVQKLCSLCKYRPTSILSLFAHMQSHLGELTEICLVCNMQLSSKQALASHMKIAHTEKAPICSVCDADFADKEQLFDHMNKHRKTKPFVCSYCDVKLITLDSLKKHLKNNHNIKSIKELNHVCKVCNVFFYTADHLLIHRINQNHDAIDPLVCRVCATSCSSADDYRNHIWGHTLEQRDSANSVICEVCHRVFFSNFRLQFHMEAKHAGIRLQPKVDIEIPITKQDLPIQQFPKVEEVVACDKCNRPFRGIENLEKHKLVCPVIIKENAMVPSPLKQAQQLVTPVVTQAQVLNEFSCNLCGRKFSNSRLLASHMKIHSGNRPVFQCEECNQIYGKKQQVLDHIKQDHAEQVQQHQQQQQMIQIPQQAQIVQFVNQQEIEPMQHEQVETLQHSQHQMAEGTSTATWSQLKTPNKITTVDQDAVYGLMTLPDF